LQSLEASLLGELYTHERYCQESFFAKLHRLVGASLQLAAPTPAFQDPPEEARGAGVGWSAFTSIWEKLLKKNIIIQTKCGIRQGFYDFSKEHILNSVEGSLSRLKTDYIDILLLHRPDTLMEPDEVSEAFSELHKTGKVRYFGVCNENQMQMKFLKKHFKYPMSLLNI
jgi:hypothetical protein